MFEYIDAMLGGTGRFRFIIQPLVAIMLGIRDGRRDAEAGREPYAAAVLFARGEREATLKSGLATLVKPFGVGVLLDMVLQFFIFRSVHFWIALIVGTVLITLPYTVSRGLAGRAVRRRRGGRDDTRRAA